MNKKTITRYVFDCPVHGREREVFCFRAYDDKLIPHWKKIEYSEEEKNFEAGELRKFHKAFVEKAIEDDAKFRSWQIT